jgi:hypothetical protein
MKTLAFALAALGTLAATPAFAGLEDEVARPVYRAVMIIPAQTVEKGAGPIVTSETDGRTGRASLEGIKIAPRPVMPEDLRQSGGH